MPDELAQFLLVCAVLTVTPGPDMALVIRSGLAGGSRAAWWTGLGCCTGISVHATAAVAGLAGVLAASPVAYRVLELAGAAYLAYLGVRALLSLRRAPGALVAPDDAEPAGRWRHYRQGLLCNLLNPKIALLFLTLLPQFVAPGENRVATSAVLAGFFLAVAVLWWRGFSLGVAALGRVLTDPTARRVTDGLTGAVLLALGVRVAVQAL